MISAEDPINDCSGIVYIAIYSTFNVENNLL